MAIRKDLDDMLNNLKGNSDEKKASARTEPAKHKSIYDNMSVDDLLNALTAEKKPSLAENILNELEEKESKAPEEPDVVQKAPETPVPEQKKKVVITGELPDYEELRRFEEKNKQHGYIRSEVDPSADKQEIIPEPEVFPEPEIIPEPETKPEPENPVTVAEDVPDNGSLSEEPEVQPVEEPIQNESEEESGRKKKSLFSKRRKKHSDDKNSVGDLCSADDEKIVESEDVKPESIEENVPVDSAEDENDMYQPDADEPEESATELIEAALAAINGVQDADDDTAETDEEDESKADSKTEEKNDSGKKDGVTSLIDDIRENAANAIAEIEEQGRNAEDEKKKEHKRKHVKKSEETPDAEKNETESSEEQIKLERKGRFTAALTNILDEDPEVLLDVKSEKTEESEENPPKKKKLKRRFYAILGVIFTVFAVIGIVVTAGRGIKMLKSFTSGETKKDGFTELVYPMVIMDIESFDKPSDLTSEQIITASIWSIIMNDEKLEKYPVNAAGGDVISISAYDVEAEAVALFGQEHTAFEHTTVGPVTSRFYYDPEKGVYNVPVHPIVFTYEPEVKSIVKSGSEYTITVDYIDEKPAWMEKSVSKSVEFHVTEKNDGTYQFDAMKILFVKNNL